MKLLLVLPSFVLTLLLVVHAVRVRGGRAALWFFVPAFLFGVVRGNSVAALAGSENGGPYIFSDAVINIGRAELPACVGWVFALYLSWTLAEGIVSKLPSMAGRVFPLSAFGLLAMGCFSYAVETTASGVGWWRWNIVRRTNPFLVGGTHLFGTVEWMSVGLDFLVPFLLFRTAKGARSALAWASLTLYPLHWITHWKQVIAPGYPHAYEIYHAIIALSVPVFPLLRAPSLREDPPRETPKWIRRIPAGAVMGMFLVLAAADVGVLRDSELLISILPLCVFLAASIAPLRALVPVSAGAAGLTLAGSLLAGRGLWISAARTLPMLVPLAAAGLWGETLGLLRRPARRSLYRAVIGVVVLATAVGMVRAKREREAYSLLLERARIRMASGDATGAERMLKQALALKPNVNLAPKLLATLYGGRGRFEEAWRFAHLSLDLDPTDWEAHQLAGNVLRAQGKSEEAMPRFERALLLNPSDAQSAKGLAEGYFKQQRYADGIGVLRRALARNVRDLELYHLLGAVLVQTRDFREARRVVDRALELNPEDPSAHLLMAYVWAGTGNIAAARVECEKVLQIDPGDAEARRLLDSLR